MAEDTLALLRGLSSLAPTPLPDCLQTLLKVIVGLLRRWLVRWRPGHVHSSMVLGEEIFAIEVVECSGSAVGKLVIWVAEVSIATVKPKLKMLRRDVALPFILRGEAAFAAVMREGADKGAAVTVLVVGSFSWGIFGLAFG